MPVNNAGYSRASSPYGYWNKPGQEVVVCLLSLVYSPQAKDVPRSVAAIELAISITVTATLILLLYVNIFFRRETLVSIYRKRIFLQ